MIVPTGKEVDDLTAYLESLRPAPSPFLTVDGKLTEAARRGKVLFEGKADCASCHPAPYFTDKQRHDVGAETATDPGGGYDTPTLLEAYRTAPYLHDGRALTIEDSLMIDHDGAPHGNVKALSEQELKDLVEYVLSL
jgi:cytochrome c peroxidase